MRTTILALIFLSIYSLALAATPVSAAKKRVWSPATATNSNSSASPSVSARLTGWKQYLNLSFRGLAATNGGINYELTFSGNGVEQGIYGTVKPDEGNISRSLFLGTCSHGACVSYKNINTLRLAITYTTKTGQNITKKYKVKY